MAHLATIAGLAFTLAASGAPGLADEGPSIRWRWVGARLSVEVIGLDAANLAELARPGRDAESWTALLAVGVDPGSGPLRPIAGRYWVEGPTLRFEPRFPTDRNVTLVVRFNPERLPRPKREPVRTARISLREPPRAPTTRLVRIDPTPDVLPENLLKFYLSFSEPMGRGEAYQRVQILDASGRPLDAPFLEIGEELWNDAGTRLTLLLDPGRIKRGLVPREEDGPILEAGKSYTLVVDRAWLNADGRPLVAGVRKPFRAGPADETQPDPTTWTLAPPVAATREPLAITFPEPLDHALLTTSLVITDLSGKPIPGQIDVGAEARNWAFRPDAPWAAGDYRVEVNPDLEDLVGNSVGRPFEVDAVRAVEAPAQARPRLVPFSVRGRPS